MIHRNYIEVGGARAPRTGPRLFKGALARLIRLRRPPAQTLRNSPAAEARLPASRHARPPRRLKMARGDQAKATESASGRYNRAFS